VAGERKRVVGIVYPPLGAAERDLAIPCLGGQPIALRGDDSGREPEHAEDARGDDQRLAGAGEGLAEDLDCSAVRGRCAGEVADWMSTLCNAKGPDTDPATATRTATLVIATIRGLLLDLLATGDRDRVQDAAESFLATLEQKAQPPKPHDATDDPPVAASPA
jgi:hypothetical protein